MADELVMKLRLWGVIWPEDVDKPEGHLYQEAADRIEQLVAIKEELEAKLLKAINTLEYYAGYWADDKTFIRTDDGGELAGETIKELTGEE